MLPRSEIKHIECLFLGPDMRATEERAVGCERGGAHEGNRLIRESDGDKLPVHTQHPEVLQYQVNIRPSGNEGGSCIEGLLRTRCIP